MNEHVGIVTECVNFSGFNCFSFELKSILFKLIFQLFRVSSKDLLNFVWKIIIEKKAANE